MTDVAKAAREAGSETDAPSLWHQRDFMLLWSGQTVSEMGSAVTQIALPLVAVFVLKATTFQVGLLTAATTAAFALPADRPSRGRALVGLHHPTHWPCGVAPCSVLPQR